MAPVKVGICKAGQNQQQNKLLLRGEPDDTGHKIVIFTPSMFWQAVIRTRPVPQGAPSFLVTKLS